MHLICNTNQGPLAFNLFEQIDKLKIILNQSDQTYLSLFESTLGELSWLSLMVAQAQLECINSNDSPPSFTPMICEVKIIIALTFS